MELEEIRADIAAFADSEEDVIVDKGMAIFQRNRQMYDCRLLEVAGEVEVEIDGARIPYRKFLGEELGRLSVLAEAIRQKREDVQPYIDTKATVIDSLNRAANLRSGVDILWDECRAKSVGETKLIFLTGDAGDGKTALLRRLTRRFADAYSRHQTETLLLHIDTQARSFVRLEEAVARDLGQLRIAGVYYSGIIRLIRRGLLAIAIDGFDELLAEVGFGEAYSGLGGFLRQLDGNGIVVASARSAYFEVENYAAQTRLLTSLPGSQVTVQHMRLARWERPEALEMFTLFRSPEGTAMAEPGPVYDELCQRLGTEHPVLHRPFLVFQMASLLTSSRQPAGRIADELGPSALQVVPNVITALLRREVEEKWRHPAGQPYLTLEQHVDLLSAIADEMWTQGKNSLPVDLVQVITEAVIEDLKIAATRRIPIIQRVKAHALFHSSSTSQKDLTFDHDEFLNYFLASRVVRLLKARDTFGLQRLCEMHSFPRIVGVWAANIEPWTEGQAVEIVMRLSSMTRKEVRSTYLKQNAGLLASQLARNVGTRQGAGFVFDSMYFEGDVWTGSSLSSAEFQKCTFINVNLADSHWSNCHLNDCRIDGLTCSAGTSFSGCVFTGTSYVLGVLISEGDEPAGLRNYVPEACMALVERKGGRFEIQATHPTLLVPVAPEKRRALDVFLRIFSRNSGATEDLVRMKLGTRYAAFRASALPVLLRRNVIRRTDYRGRGDQERYELNHPIEDILRAEDPDAPVPQNLRDFWNELRQ